MLASNSKEKEIVNTSKNRNKNWGNSLIKEVKTNYIMFLMLLPVLVYFLVFSYAPMIGIILAFKEYNYSDGILGSPFVGFKNFEFLFKSNQLFNMTKNTILYNLLFISTRLILQITLAILISEVASKAFKKISQSMLFLPHFVSYVLLGAFVYNLFNYEHGTMNTILKSFGFEAIDYYNKVGVWKYILLAFYQWKYVGYGTVIFLATIIGISTEYYEAARIDGANKFQEIKYITLPSLKPTVIILVLFAIGGIMRGQFELFYQIIGNNGQLFKSTDIIDTVVFRMLSVSFDIGMGTAVGVYQSVFGLLLILFVNYIIKKIEKDYALF